MKTSLKILAGALALAALTTIGYMGWGTALEGWMQHIIFFGVQASFLFTSLYLAVQMNQAYWKVAKSKDTLMIERRDGFYEMTDAEYYTGWLKSKFGFHLLTSKNKEITTGKNIAIALDMFGPTVSPEQVATVEAFAKKYNIQSATELEDTLDKWHKCTKCKWEGIPEPRTETETKEVGGIEQKIEKVVGMSCGNSTAEAHHKCLATDDELETATPSVLVPFYKTISLDSVKYLMKHQMNPSKAFILTDRLARIKMGFDTKLLEFLGKMLGFGLFGLFILVGLGLLLNFAGVI